MMKLVDPSPAFAARSRRLFLYLWKWKKLHFLRLPSGAGLYLLMPAETPLALELPTGERFRAGLKISPQVAPYFDLLAGFAPVAPVELRAALKRAEWRTSDIQALSARELRERFGAVPVAPEDAYASGQCWFGSKAWAEVWLGEPAPPVSRQLARLDVLPSIEVPAFIAAAAYAAAYVVGDNDALLSSASESDVACAVAEGRKADGTSAGRAPRLHKARPGRRQDGAQIVAGPLARAGV